MAQALPLSPIRASTQINDFVAHRVHVVGHGCEASFFVRLNPVPRPGYWPQGVALDECHGFTREQCDSFAAEMARTYPGLRDRTHHPVTEDHWRGGIERGEQALKDPGFAVSARYLPDRARLEIVYSPTDVHLVDLGVFEELACATAADLCDVELSPYGRGLHFPRLDVDLSVPMLWRERFERARDQEADEAEEAA